MTKNEVIKNIKEIAEELDSILKMSPENLHKQYLFGRPDYFEEEDAEAYIPKIIPVSENEYELRDASNIKVNWASTLSFSLRCLPTMLQTVSEVPPYYLINYEDITKIEIDTDGDLIFRLKITTPKKTIYLDVYEYIY